MESLDSPDGTITMSSPKKSQEEEHRAPVRADVPIAPISHYALTTDHLDTMYDMVTEGPIPVGIRSGCRVKKLFRYVAQERVFVLLLGTEG